MARIVGSVTQGGADAFAIASIQTALTGQTRQAYRVQQVVFEGLRLTAANAANIEMCLARRTKAAMPLTTDVDVIVKQRKNVDLVTSGGFVYDPIVIWTPPFDVIVVEDPLYLIVDTNATGLTQTLVCTIDYELVTISDVDRLTLLTQSLV